MCDDRSGTNHRALADRYAAKNDRAAADRGASLHPRRNNLPICFGLQSAVGGRSRVKIVGEHDSVPNENIIFDRYTFTDERVRGNLAAAPDEGVFLNLDECSDFCVVAKRAAVEIDQIGLEDLDSATQNNVGRNWHEDDYIRHLREQWSRRAHNRASQKGTVGTIQQNLTGINSRSNGALGAAFRRNHAAEFGENEARVLE